MNKLRKLAVVIVALTGVSVAQADLITFQIDSRMELGCGQCLGFEEDTGLDRGNFDVVALFTLDTNALDNLPAEDHALYLFDQPGTGMSVTIGSLTLFFSPFEIEFRHDDPDCTQLFVQTQSIFTSGGIFNTSNCYEVEEDLADFALSTFVNSDLSGFFGTTYDSIIFPPTDENSDWWIQGGVTGIARVPEPGTLALLGLGLAGMGMSRRKKKV